MKSTIRYCWVCGESATVRFLEGRDRKYCESCDTILYENPFPTTAALVTDEPDRLLLVKRRYSPARNRWCLPGGFLELGETPQEGVLRELEEETNLAGQVEKLVGLSPSLHGVWGDVLVIGFHVTINGGTMQPGDDAREVRYFPVDEIPQLAFNTHTCLVNLFLDNRR